MVISVTQPRLVAGVRQTSIPTFGSANLPDPPKPPETGSALLPWSLWNAFQLKKAKPMDMPVAAGSLNRLVAQMREANGIQQPITVHVVNQPSYNARALSNGVVMVHLGLLQQAESPEEVAFVLAHEIAHRHLQHHESRTQAGISASLGGLAVAHGLRKALRHGRGSSMAARVAVSMIAWMPPLQWVAKQHREHEMQADLNAIRLLSKAGYSPRGYERFVERGLAWEQEHEKPFLAKACTTLLGRSHPPLSARKVALENGQQAESSLSRLPKPIMSPEEWNALKQAVAEDESE